MNRALTSTEINDWDTFATQAEQDMLQLLQWKEMSQTEVSIAFVSQESIQKLNHQYLQKNKPTDVLSFTQNELFDDFMCLGDIILCVNIAQQQAIEKNKTLEQELRLLLCHGFLHLLGYDHAELDEEKIMFALQEELVQMLESHVIA